MLRRTNIVFLAVATTFTWMIVDSQPCDAQRILRRIQDRLPIRILPLESPRVPSPELNTENAGGASPLRPPTQVSPSQISPDQSRRIQPQRVSPLDPQSDPNTDASARRPVDANRYGQSILSPITPGNQPELAEPGIESTTSSQTGDPTLGIQVLPSRRGMAGLEVAEIRTHSLADDAGLRRGDVIVAVEGKPTPTVADIARQLRGRQGGDEIEATIVRRGRTATFSIPLVYKPSTNVAASQSRSMVAQASAEESIQTETRPALPVAEAEPRPASSAETLGVIPAEPRQIEPTPAGITAADPDDPVQATNSVEPAIALEAIEPVRRKSGSVSLGVTVTDSQSVRGAIVTDVAENSPAAAAGLKPGDRIVSVDGRLVWNQSRFDEELAQRSVGDQFALQLVRDGALVGADIILVDPASDSLPGAAANKKSDAGGVLDGFGSVFGGFLGTSDDAKPARKEVKKEPADDDEMAFGDDEPIGQVIFEEEVDQAIDELKSDPPSLETLQPPPSKKEVELNAPPRGADSIEELRKEIERLQERLKALEENS